jgi:hypothetical protein
MHRTLLYDQAADISYLARARLLVLTQLTPPLPDLLGRQVSAGEGAGGVGVKQRQSYRFNSFEDGVVNRNQGEVNEGLP